MTPGRGARRAALVLLALAAAACGDGGPTVPDGSGGDASVSIAGPDALEVVVGDTVRLQATSSTGATLSWRSTAVAIASVAGGAVVGLRPGSSSIVASISGAADTVSVTVTARPNGYTAAEVDYFMEVALGFEYGNASRTVRRWGGNVGYRVYGSPDDADLEQLERVVAEINDLTSTADMVEDGDNPQVEIHFAPVADFPGILSSYVPGNIGYFSVWFDGTGHFTRAVVLLASDREREVRDHLIREEITQILGLGRDSDLYPESIFYQPWSLVSEYAPIDRALIEMLYRPEVRPGMDAERVGAVLRRLTRGVVDVQGARAALVTASGGSPSPTGVGSGGNQGGRRAAPPGCPGSTPATGPATTSR